MDFKNLKEIYSLSINVTVNDLLDNGYASFYNESYSHNTTYSELKNIKSYCNFETIICVGASAYNSDILSLVSCGNCIKILTDTPINNSTLINGAYWYMTSNYSFGFSPKKNISQYFADTYDCIVNDNNKYDCNDNKRLSWHLTGYKGGWRFGTISGFNSSPDYKKHIFLKDFNQNNVSITTKSNLYGLVEQRIHLKKSNSKI